jgi:hypothetical protein
MASDLAGSSIPASYWVLGAIERQCGHVFIEEMAEADKEREPV